MTDKIPRNAIHKVGDDNRRQWGRYPSEKSEVTLSVNGRSKVGVLVDESIGGLCVQVADTLGLKTEDVAELVYRDETVQGHIMNIRPTGDGSYFVGISWPGFRVSADFGKNRRASNLFLNHRGMSLVCDTVDFRDDGSVSVSLWDGATFEVPKDRVSSMTTKQRKAQLESLGPLLKVLNGLYKLGRPEAGPDLIEAVLDFEFCEEPVPAAD